MPDRYSRKKEALSARLREGAGPVGLQKETSNLFRDRAAGARRRLHVRGFNAVLLIKENFFEAEGMGTYWAPGGECLAHGVMPAAGAAPQHHPLRRRARRRR